MTKKIAEFADRFAELLEDSKFSLSYIAKSLSISYKTVYSWTKGNRTPKPPTITTVANWFGVSPDWLAGYDVDKYTGIARPARTIEARLISNGVDAMPPEQRERALNMFRLMFEQYADKFDNDEGENDDDEA